MIHHTPANEFLFSFPEPKYTTEYVLSQKGSLNLAINGFQFYKQKTRSSMTYWSCKVRKCPARVTQHNETKQLKLSQNFHHNHENFLRKTYKKRTPKPF